MPAFSYLEEQGDLSPMVATFSERSQSATGTYLFSLPTETNLIRSVVDLLGYTDARAGDGRIRRTLPTRHPLYQWLWAESCSPQGVGNTFSVQTPAVPVGAPTLPQYPLYASYHYRITWAARPYNMWVDTDIEVYQGSFYDKDGTLTQTKAATEWWRFCEWLWFPANQYIHAQQGQMKFRVSGAGGAAQPDGFVFQDSPRLYLPDSVVKVRWHCVPYRYIWCAKSFLSRFVGHVNQGSFHPGPLGGGETAAFPSGSLLYLGATVLQVYSPCVPSPGAVAFNEGDSFQRARLCDLELNFLFTARKDGAASGNRPTPANSNWINAGHNLLPWITTRKFYYATTYDPSNEADTSKWRPMYNSFPFALLFTDPEGKGVAAVDP